MNKDKTITVVRDMIINPDSVLSSMVFVVKIRPILAFY
jgi:hypothetical protein